MSYEPLREKARAAHFFDTIKRAGTKFVPEQHGRLFVPWNPISEESRKALSEQTPHSDESFRLDGIQLQFQGRAKDFPALIDGVMFQLYIAECPWPIRAVGEEGIFGTKFELMNNKWEGDEGYGEYGKSVTIPARQSFYIVYDLSAEALRILATNEDVGVAIHLIGERQRDLG